MTKDEKVRLVTCNLRDMDMKMRPTTYRKCGSATGVEASPRVAFRMSPYARGVITDGPSLRPCAQFKPEGLPPEVDHDQSYGSGHIRCPACRWQPDKNSRWFCVAMGPPENFATGCGHGWNTFDTRGQCPGCKHQWRHTTCLSCSVTSLHDDWYAVPGKP